MCGAIARQCDDDTTKWKQLEIIGGQVIGPALWSHICPDDIDADQKEHGGELVRSHIDRFSQIKLQVDPDRKVQVRLVPFRLVEADERSSMMQGLIDFFCLLQAHPEWDKQFQRDRLGTALKLHESKDEELIAAAKRARVLK